MDFFVSFLFIDFSAIRFGRLFQKISDLYVAFCFRTFAAIFPESAQNIGEHRETKSRYGRFTKRVCRFQGNRNLLIDKLLVETNFQAQPTVFVLIRKSFFV